MFIYFAMNIQHNNQHLQFYKMQLIQYVSKQKPMSWARKVATNAEQITAASAASAATATVPAIVLLLAARAILHHGEAAPANSLSAHANRLQY